MSNRSVLRRYVDQLQQLLSLDTLAYGDLQPAGRGVAGVTEEITTPLVYGSFLVFPDETWIPIEAAWAQIKSDPAVAKARAEGLATSDLYEGSVAEQAAFFAWLLPRLQSKTWLYVLGAAASVAAVAGIVYSTKR